MDDNARWLDPETAADGVLSPTQIAQWRDSGAVLVDGLIPQSLLAEVIADAEAHFPAAGSTAAKGIENFGSNQHFVFPAASAACNQVTLHLNLLRAVADLLGVAVEEIRLSQSDLWPKYGRAPSANDFSNADQRIHCDYPNHMLVHPPPWEHPAAVEIIIYLSDMKDTAGGTAVVPRTGQDDPAYPWPIVQTPGVAGMRYVNDRARAEAYLEEANPEAAEFRRTHLYPRERLTRYRTGTVLFYRHDVWHRGTPLAPGKLRFVHNLTFRRADCEWINTLHPGWSWSMYRPSQFMEKLVADCTPAQRAVLGFPPPGASYWSTATIDAVEARYEAHGIDMSPYRRALSADEA